MMSDDGVGDGTNQGRPALIRTPSVNSTVERLHTIRNVRRLLRNESNWARPHSRKAIKSDDPESATIVHHDADDDEDAPLIKRSGGGGGGDGDDGKDSDMVVMSNLFRESKVLASLLVFVPLGIMAGVFHWGSTVNFVFNFLAIIPLAWLLGIGTEDMALRTTSTMGGLLNATFGNAVEMIVSLVALSKGMVRLVQTSLLGSILSNMLLVLGGAFFAGGMYHKQQRFNRTGASVFASLLLVASIALVVPAAFASSFKGTDKDELLVSRIVSGLILCVYILYLYFQLSSHQHLFVSEGGDDGEQPLFSRIFVAVLMVSVTACVSLNSEFLVDSIAEFVKKAHINQTFVGVILIPIVGNAAEHYTAVQVAMKDKMDLSIGVAIGSSIQIALFMLPFTVLMGVAFQQPMSLNFQPFETITLLLSVIMVNGSVASGTSNYLQGALLICVYLIVATAFFFRPDK